IPQCLALSWLLFQEYCRFAEFSLFRSLLENDGIVHSVNHKGPLQLTSHDRYAPNRSPYRWSAVCSLMQQSRFAICIRSFVPFIIHIASFTCLPTTKWTPACFLWSLSP